MRPEHNTQKPEEQMTHAEYVKSDLHERMMMTASSAFEVIENRCNYVRQCIEAGELDYAEHQAQHLEQNLFIALNHLQHTIDNVQAALQRSRTGIQ